MTTNMWTAVVTALGGYSVLVAAMGWLLANLITERQKRIAKMDEIRYGKLHELRAMFLTSLYSKFDSELNGTNLFEFCVKLEPGRATSKNLQGVFEKLSDASCEFSDKKLYLSPRLEKQIEGFLDGLRGASGGTFVALLSRDNAESTMTTALSDQQINQILDYWKEHGSDVEDILTEIKKEFRNLLGTTETSTA